MHVVVDANPVISLLIKPNKSTLELFFLEELEIFAPELLMKEIERNRDIIMEKSSLDLDTFNEFIFVIKKLIKIVPENEFLKFQQKAEEICPDEKDITYFALALYLGCPIWSNEKKLKKQNNVIMYSTYDMIKLFNLK